MRQVPLDFAFGLVASVFFERTHPASPTERTDFAALPADGVSAGRLARRGHFAKPIDDLAKFLPLRTGRVFGVRHEVGAVAYVGQYLVAFLVHRRAHFANGSTLDPHTADDALSLSTGQALACG